MLVHRKAGRTIQPGSRLQVWTALVLAVALVPVTTVHADPPAVNGREVPHAPCVERVAFRDATGNERQVDGRVLVEAVDGGILLQGPDGRLWTVEKEQLVSREATAEIFKPLPPEALGRQIAAELGGNWEIVVTKHYVVCSRAGKSYTQWCGALFERLYAAFQNYWKRGVKLNDPEFPLVALVFADEQQFADFATKDAGPGVAAAKGYFSIATNRIALYDLLGSGRDSAMSVADVSRKLSTAAFNVATVVHEATHQIAFNSGMHTRYADNPLWLAEGMAMFFETPDLTSDRGWTTVGTPNVRRLQAFQEYLSRRPPDSLQTLIQSDARFIDEEQMGDAYAEAWALSYFLIKTRKPAYCGFLNRLAQKPPLRWDKPEVRLAEFRAAFGDMQKLDAEFVKFMRPR
jgi:hypothetical protein